VWSNVFVEMNTAESTVSEADLTSETKLGKSEVVNSYPVPILDTDIPSTSKRSRKRRLDLNSCFSVSNFICSESYCGLTLPDEDSLEQHYRQHFHQELEKLKNIRIKKKPENSEVQDLRNARKDALEKLKARREDRIMRRAAGNLGISSNFEDVAVTECPICQLHILEDSGGNLRDHFSACVRSQQAGTAEDDFIDVDDEDYEEYEWAGQKRIRSTSMFKGGLKAAGFLTIKKTREDEVLDVIGDDEEIGTAQYNDTDLLNIEDEVLDSASEVSINRESPSEPECSADTSEPSTSSITPFNNPMCKICMSSYDSPLTSTTCWHVHCERCWMLALGSKKLCPQCKAIVTPSDLRKIYL